MVPLAIGDGRCDAGLDARARSLRLHPLVVLVATTAGTLLFGLMGAILAAL